MRGYKEIAILVPASMEWFAIDDIGDRWVYAREPVYKQFSGWWGDGGISFPLGRGPRPRDASKVLYRI